MSWMQKLYETYEACSSEVGKMSPGRVPLLPAGQITQLAQVEAMIDAQGNWCAGRSRVISDKAEMTTIIPATEQSSSRTSSPVPHPLFDKLQYVAGDFLDYGGEEKRYRFREYMEALQSWCASEYCHPGIRAMEAYLRKGRLIADLVADGVLHLGQDGKLLAKWDGDKEATPEIFKVCANQQDAFIRFRVMGCGEEQRLWMDPEAWECWTRYENSREAQQDICCVLGKRMTASELSPKKIRNPGDGAKLISSNDLSGFTFRGRFDKAQEAFCVGRETTDKAHSALRWLISRQGFVNGEQVVLAWSPKVELPAELPMLDSLDLADDLEAMMGTDEPVVSTMEEFADRFNKVLAGYHGTLDGGEDAAVIGLDSATPGRLSIFYYRELLAVDLLERVARWHSSCTWPHRYRFVHSGTDEKGKTKSVPAPFVGAPAPIDIVEAAYGRGADDKLKKSAVERLLPCIIDGARLPRDIVECAVRRATNSATFDSKTEASKTVSIACALVRKFYNDRAKREVWKMELDLEQKDRSYLFGRALAYARRIEEIAQEASGNESRQTNAERMQVAFTQHPARLWKELYHRLVPYLSRMRTPDKQKSIGWLEGGMNAVIREIGEGFTDKPLDSKYILGYQSQMNDFYTSKKKKGEENNGDPEQQD